MSLNVLNATDRQEWLLSLIRKYESQKKASDAIAVDDAMFSRVLRQDYEPKDLAIRVKFRMPVKGTIPINGVVIADGAQIATSSRKCACGVDFVPNVPWRHACYSCHEIRAR